MREELGDVLLQVLFHSVLAEERGAFRLSRRRERPHHQNEGRHPHLYGDGAKEPWEKMKSKKRTSYRRRPARRRFRRFTARIGCRTAPPASASIGPTGRVRRRRSRRSLREDGSAELTTWRAAGNAPPMHDDAHELRDQSWAIFSSRV